MRRFAVLVFVVGLVTATWAPVAAQTEDTVRQKASAGAAQVTGSVSISSHLLDAMALAEGGAQFDAIDQQVPVVSFVGSQIEVELRFDSFTSGAVDAAKAAGLTVSSSYPNEGWLTGTIDPVDIRNLGTIDGLATVHPMYGWTTAAGSVDNQANVSMRANKARNWSGADGSGVEIGILSDSFDANGTGTTKGSNCKQRVSGTASQSSGDLPASVGVLADAGSGTDEGRGMAELIHDVAPGSALTFQTGSGGEAAFAQGIRALADCGADVIVDDLIYFAEPMFQDGPVAQAAQDVAADGIPYFSSAGNQGTFGVNDTFVDIDPGTMGAFGPDFHDFGGGDTFGRITLDDGEGIRLILQWADPFDGSLGPGASADFDLYLLSAASPDPANIVAFSETTQGCNAGPGIQGGDPLEVIFYQNTTGSAQDVFLVINRWCTNPGAGDHLRVATYGLTTSVTDLGFEGDIFRDMQQYGHAVAKDARSVGAVFYGEIDDPTVQPPNGRVDVEPFSSLGGKIPIYFNRTGNPLSGAPRTRFKPEIAAADGTNTSFFGNDIGFDPDSDPNFFGTSAAAPHAAAVAALLLDDQPGLTRAQVYKAMESTAIDIEKSGKDALSGYGLVDAFNTLATCNGLPATHIGTKGNDTINGTSGDDVIVTFAGDDFVDGKGGNDTICLGAGADVGEGGPGADTIFGGPGVDKLKGEAGKDTLDGGISADTLIGGGSADTLYGGAGKDILKGGPGNDILDGGTENDRLEGGDDNDTLRGGAGNDVLKGGDGKDTLNGAAGADTLMGENGNDKLIGGGGNDNIVGGDGADTAEGGGGKDDISGGSGKDILKGGAKADTINGGAGNDSLFGGSGNDTLVGGGGTDTVAGGSGTDTCVGENQTSCEL
ncbi:MAG: S8 family serine peptidase [bacterium]|nr:S8 family serine peptidase [bacterium]